MPKNRSLPDDGELRDRMVALRAKGRARFMNRLDPPELDAIDKGWGVWGHKGQHAPPGGWRTWVIMAGRGFGKTRAGAEWVTAIARANPEARIALVAATLDEARRLMIDGPSGLIAVAGAEVERFYPSHRLLRFTNGAEATLFSGASPEQLRGPEHHAAWCDELAKWKKPGETWDMLQLGLRRGDRPRALVTTTPRPGPVLRRIMEGSDTVLSGGPTMANPHLPAAFVEAMTEQYAGTRLGRQEVDGELLTDVEGALWTVELIEACRVVDHHRPSVARPERSAQRDACRLVDHDRSGIARPERSAQREVEGRTLQSSVTRPSTSLGTSEESVRVVSGPPPGPGKDHEAASHTVGFERSRETPAHPPSLLFDFAQGERAMEGGNLIKPIPKPVQAEPKPAQAESSKPAQPEPPKPVQPEPPKPVQPDPPKPVQAEPVEALPFSLASQDRNAKPPHAQNSTPTSPITYTRTVIGVDPPAGPGTCGIVVCARDEQGLAYVLADHSVTNRPPEAWARAVAAAAEIHRADRIVAERNQGGEMVRAVLRAAQGRLPVKLVHASIGKSARAEPVHALFEAGRVRLAGRFPELEAELCGLIAGGGYQPVAWPGSGGPGASPDRADAMVWALTELLLSERKALPRVMGF